MFITIFHRNPQFSHEYWGGAFMSCSSLTSLEIPNSITIIGRNAFSACSSLKTITLSETLEDIQYGTFEDCSSLASLSIPGSVERIAQYLYHKDYENTFSGCKSLKKFTIEYSPISLKSGYEDHGFEGATWTSWINKLEDLYIDRALKYSMAPRSLKELTLGEHIEKVQVKVSECTDLKKLTSYAVIPPAGIAASANQYKNIEVKVPKGTLEAYQNAEGWKDFWNISEMEDEGSGIESVISDQTKTEIGRYNLQGRKVTDDYTGIVIVKYSDGSTAKVVNR